MMPPDAIPERSCVPAGRWSVRLTGTFKSVPPLTWSDVPPLAVLTGPNGSGKSQLLAAIQSGIDGANRLQNDEKLLADLQIQLGNSDRAFDIYVSQSMTYQADDIKRMAEDVERGAQSIRAQILEIETRIEQALSASVTLHGATDTSISDPGDIALASDAFQGGTSRPIAPANVSKLLASIGDRGYRYGKSDAQRRSQTGAMPVTAETLSVSPGLAVHLSNPLDGLGLAIQAHRVEHFHRIEQRGRGEEPSTPLPPPPYDVVNALLEEVGFPLRVSAPRLRIDEPEPVRFLSRGVEVEVENLSSGERTLVGLVSGLYAGGSGAHLPALFLLDEPDAHLHPSLTAQVLGAIKTVLVERLGVRVLLTTHSPSTVALAPDDSVFVLRDGAVHKTDKWEAVSTLTAGIVTVGPQTKHVFVEDHDDVAFYTAATQTVEVLDPTFPKGRLVFLPANKDKANPAKPGGGGCTRVLAWVGDLGTPSVAGLIDRDGAPADVTNPPRVWMLGRHSLENYLLDPLLLATYGARARGKALSSFDAFVGNERGLLSASAAQLQPIVDEVVSAIARVLSLSASSNPQGIAYVAGPTVTVPDWWMTTRGHDLVAPVNAALGFPPVPAKLVEMLRLTRLVPQELAGIFRQIAVS